MTQHFFNVTPLETVLALASETQAAGKETIGLSQGEGRILARDVDADADLPPFARSTMDGYAVRAADTFGSSEGNPAYLTLKGSISMAETPSFDIGPGEAAYIPTGGMLPQHANSVVMIEHTEKIDDTTIEVTKSVAPGQNVILQGEDFKKGARLISRGTRIRAQEAGLLAAFGHDPVHVYRKPIVGIISTGDEIVPVNATPPPGSIRDINTYTLSGLVRKYGGIPQSYGIIRDQQEQLFQACQRAVSETDMILISGGSSVGMRDFTIDVLSQLENSRIRVHGIPISPGKPTILAQTNGKFVWGIPGHVASAMIVFCMVVRPFLDRLSGMVSSSLEIPHDAVLLRNIASAQGRTDFIRVQLFMRENELYADPILGKSGLIRTMTAAQGIIEVDMNTEGLDKGARVHVRPI